MTPSAHYDKFRRLLSELFMFDQADLDFGIYRIMNAKRGEIERFLERDLLPQVRETLGALQSGDRASLEAELHKAVEAAKSLGVDPESSPKVKQLREQLHEAGDLDALEAEVFSDLYNFFRRYYREGDFISQRRYKEGVYAIPYEGEEVKLHWANHDQYYVKSTEYFRDYTFKLRDGRRIHFKLVDADSECDNNRPTNGNDRRFIVCADQPLVEQDGELVIRFEYRPDADGRKQQQLNAEARDRIFAAKGFAKWTDELMAKAPTAINPDRTLLERHLVEYTARNTFDYFIHKNLGAFLRRELDFYIKNEIVHLDDIENESAPRVEQYLAKVRAIRRIAHKIIDFLAQIEDFQKKLWLKKKFVVETNYCITLDRIPKELYPEVASNERQREQWVKLFAIDQIRPHDGLPGYSEPLTTAFLEHNPYLVLDTALFSPVFVAHCLSRVDDLDRRIDGLIINADNHQALSLLAPGLAGRVRCVYIDPPYNTGNDGFLYKDSFQTSSWACFLLDRLTLARHILSEDGVLFSSINEIERCTLEFVLRLVFGGQTSRVEELIWVQDTVRNNSPLYSTNHEYIEVFAKNRPAVEADRAMFREPKPGYDEIMSLVRDMNERYAPVAEVERAIVSLMREHKCEYADDIRQRGGDVAEEKRNDPWKGIYPYHNVEYRDSDGRLVPEEKARDKSARIWVWREVDPSMPSGKQAASTRDPNSDNYRFYKPRHPVTGTPCAHPKRGFAFPQRAIGNRPSFESYVADDRIVFKDDPKMPPQQKYFLHEVADIVSTSVIRQYADGEQQLDAMFGRKGVFPNPKPTALIKKLISQTSASDSIILDFFAGSGTTGDAVISLNRKDEGLRKYVLVEMGRYVDTVLIPRLQKTIYSTDWNVGQPIRRNGTGHTLKYIRLESYEDALNNLVVTRRDDQKDLLDNEPALREDYTLRYMLGEETKGSPSLLNVRWFEDPFNYRMKIATGTVGETRDVAVDLVETFNWLLGLRVKHIDTIRGVRVVEGTNPDGERVLALWRNTREIDSDKLDEWFTKQGYNTRDQEYDIIYVNGDNNLENLRRADQTWKVRITEDEFHRLMFDVQDV